MTKKLINNSKFIISLAKNVRIPHETKTDNGNYAVLSYKPFRKFATRDQARAFKRSYTGSPVVIVNTATQQIVR